MKFLLSLFLLGSVVIAEELPILPAAPGEAVLETDFERPVYQLPKSTWQARQGTRWKIAGGVLSGIPSSLEYQSEKTHHRGLEPRLSVPVTPAEFVCRFRIRFLEGEESAIVPFVEFGHHIVRLRFDREEGVSLLVDYESLQVAEDREFRYEPGEWISIVAALKGDEFAASIDGGSLLHAKHPVLSEPAPSGGSGLGVAGTVGGTVEIDDLTIWKAADKAPEGWAALRDSLPAFEPVVVREKPVK